MQDRYPFNYAIIRMVPKVERAEFFNIGVILYCQRKKFLDLKFHIDPDKMKSLAPGLEPGPLIDHLKAWKSIALGNPASGPIGALGISERFGWLTAKRSTILQSSQIHTGLCADPQRELECLFDAFVS